MDPKQQLAEKRKDLEWDGFFIGYTQGLGFTGHLMADEDEDWGNPAFEGSGNFDDNWYVWAYLKDIISDEDLTSIIEDIDGFLEQAREIIQEDSDNDFNQAGVDFHFTRNGHGAGFWDGDWERGDELTDMAKPYGTKELEVRWNEDGEEIMEYFLGG